MTADPNTPQTIPPGSLAAKLPSSESKDGSTTAVGIPPEQQEAETAMWVSSFGCIGATVLTFGLVCAIVGMLLVILPWRPEWTDNHLLMASPGLRALVANGFVRGVCSGLGVLDIWIGFSEAIHYHEVKHP